MNPQALILAGTLGVAVGGVSFGLVYVGLELVHQVMRLSMKNTPDHMVSPAPLSKPQE